MLDLTAIAESTATVIREAIAPLTARIDALEKEIERMARLADIEKRLSGIESKQAKK
ncbi:hypothetical protein [Sphingosinicella microcystinivorans]|uniref:hypothetical protein n=1 Tax=Sphingosinicella microcystinivorans TaxID=335406 RepID=UPI0022F390D7|nr:hypothetical protein [Sphingosinicella microcystinivorans]WBX83010.1 hypothetical protein PE061_14480 [Sphingosinicella microcystinivorans]